MIVYVLLVSWYHLNRMKKSTSLQSTPQLTGIDSLSPQEIGHIDFNSLVLMNALPTKIVASLLFLQGNGKRLCFLMDLVLFVWFSMLPVCSRIRLSALSMGYNEVQKRGVCVKCLLRIIRTLKRIEFLVSLLYFNRHGKWDFLFLSCSYISVSPPFLFHLD